MSNPETCQIAEYVDAANGGIHEACTNVAAHTVGVTIGTLIFDFRLCPGCRNRVIKAAKVQEASMQKWTREYSNTYERAISRLRYNIGNNAE
jgi:hypothetical protein